MAPAITGIDVASPCPSKTFGSPLSQNGSTRTLFGAKTPNNAKSKDKLDRFIPNRAALDLESSQFNLTKENQATEEPDDLTTPQKQEYKRLLAASMNVGEANRILTFKQKAPPPPDGHVNSLSGLYNQNVGAAPARKNTRFIPQTQDRILDAPDLLDDYYLNLLDWGSNNLIAVALGRSVYLWNASSGSVEELCECPDDGNYISSVSWASDGSHLAVGTADAKVQIWDVTRMKQVRELVGHSHRVSCLAWNGTILTSASRDSTIVNWDVRKRKDQACVSVLRGHEQEVCGLKWSQSGQQLASGGNDNNLCIWGADFNLQHKIPAHQAAVKAVAWCPFQSNLLATGGGTADRHIRFWNTHTGAMVNQIDTGSQVCSLQWSRHEREILSSHGFSKNQLCLWKYPSMAKVAELTGHTARVLHMAQSPDGSSVVSASADETLRFWRVFGEPAVSKADKENAINTSNGLRRAVGIR